MLTRLFKKKYRVKKGVGPLPPKKSKRADLRRWSFVFFLIGLNAMVGASWYALDLKTYFYPDANSSGEVVEVAAAPESTQSEEEEKILSIDPEQLENIVNTEAYTHAVWPGYKGDVSDGPAVRRHFADQLASVIIKTGGVDVSGTYRVHFYYVVRDDGGIQFLSLVRGGRTTDGVPRHLIKHSQKLVNIGVPGIKPGTDANGDPITVVYEIVIKFTTQN